MPPQIIDGLEALRAFVGKEVGVSDWFPVTQERVAAFAEVTEDRHWIHLDAGRARAESPYGTPIAHGFLTLALVSHLHGRSVQVRGPRRAINYGLNRLRFPAPVPAGACVAAQTAPGPGDCVPVGAPKKASRDVRIRTAGCRLHCCIRARSRHPA